MTSSAINFQWGDDTTITIGNVGQVRSRELKDGAGRPAVVQGAPAMAVFQLETMKVAHTVGTRLSDPEMQAWEGSSGTKSSFNWSA